MDLHLLSAAARIAVVFRTAIVFAEEPAARFDRTVGKHFEGVLAGDRRAGQRRAARIDRKCQRRSASGR
jgi:hypothetical protein